MSYRFQPWRPLGPDPRFEGVRLLVLGESHYEEVSDTYKFLDADAACDLTQELVLKWGAKPEGRQVFFANLFTMLSGKLWASDSPDLAPFWETIYFYNYVQWLVPGGAGHSPSSLMWTAAEQPFRDVLEEIVPDAVLVLGQRLWDNMPKQDEDLAARPEALGLICGYRLKGGKVVPAAHTRHPSSRGFDPLEWHDRVHQFLDWTRTRLDG